MPFKGMTPLRCQIGRDCRLSVLPLAQPLTPLNELAEQKDFLDVNRISSRLTSPGVSACLPEH